MEKVVFKYSLNKALYEKGLDASGVFKVKKGRKIAISLLCLFILVDSIYVSLQSIRADRIVFSIFAILCILYTLFGEKWQKNNALKKHFKEAEMEITLEKGKIHISENGGDYSVSPMDYKGFKETDDLFIIYFLDRYIILPKEEKAEEEITLARELIETFYSSATEKKEEDWGFEEFKAEEKEIEEGENNE